MRLNALVQRESVSTLRCNVSLTSEKARGTGGGFASNGSTQANMG